LMGKLDSTGVLGYPDSEDGEPGITGVVTSGSGDPQVRTPAFFLACRCSSTASRKFRK
jgi:hypothetical protein